VLYKPRLQVGKAWSCTEDRARTYRRWFDSSALQVGVGRQRKRGYDAEMLRAGATNAVFALGEDQAQRRVISGLNANCSIFDRNASAEMPVQLEDKRDDGVCR